MILELHCIPDLPFRRAKPYYNLFFWGVYLMELGAAKTLTAANGFTGWSRLYQDKTPNNRITSHDRMMAGRQVADSLEVA